MQLVQKSMHTTIKIYQHHCNVILVLYNKQEVKLSDLRFSFLLNFADENSSNRSPSRIAVSPSNTQQCFIIEVIHSFKRIDLSQ